MKITLQDRSNYLKGLLVLIGKDRILEANEKFLFKEIGRILQFSTEFVEQSLADFLDNEHISQEPPIFSNQFIAECFIKDAVKLAHIDDRFHNFESKWIASTTKKNSLPNDFITKVLASVKKISDLNINDFCASKLEF
jgi:hypothetical protein